MATEKDYQPNNFYDLTATIASGQTVSNAVDLSGTELAGFFVPTGFTGTSISLQAATSLTGPYVTVQDGNGNDVSITVAANRYIPISNLAVIAGLRFLTLVSGTAQSAAAAITLAARPI